MAAQYGINDEARNPVSYRTRLENRAARAVPRDYSSSLSILREEQRLEQPERKTRC
jgi:hypothetical protein